MSSWRAVMGPLHLLPLCDDTQARVRICQETVDAYAELYRDGIELPPVTVYRDPAGGYWVADGHHRIRAARQAGRSHIQARVLDGDRRTARLEAARANAEHGLRRTQEDDRRAVYFVLEDEVGKTWDDQQIATHCGVSLRLVRALRVSRPWATEPGLFGPVHVGRPPQPDRALEGPAKTRERAERSARKLPRFCEQLTLDPVAFITEVLEAVRKRQQAARKGSPAKGREDSPAGGGEVTPAP